MYRELQSHAHKYWHLHPRKLSWLNRRSHWYICFNPRHNPQTPQKILKAQTTLRPIRKMVLHHPNQHPITSILINHPIQYHELVNAIKLSISNSSPGDDQISHEIIKHLPSNILFYTVHLFGEMLKTNTCKDCWRHSIVTPILKSGENPTNPNSWRPIALISCLCKIMDTL